MDAVNLAEAKAHLSELIDRVGAGTQSRSPVAASRSRASLPRPRPRKRIDATALQSLTATMPVQPENAADLVRSMRDTDRY